MKRKFFGGRNDSRLADDFVFPFQERDYARPKRWKVIGEYYFDQADLIFRESCDDEFYRFPHDFLVAARGYVRFFAMKTVT